MLFAIMKPLSISTMQAEQKIANINPASELRHSFGLMKKTV